LIKLYNPKVGTILSWPAMRHYKNWPHNTIIDNMMNLEMLFWASKNGGGKNLYDIAVNHALTTMKYHFRKDYSCYHVAVYDTIDGHFIKGVTQQGYSDQSMWARGQSWAIYGFTMAYRETHDTRFLDFVQHVADVYLKRLPKDHVPYWDFDVPVTAETPRDVSSACIAASALLELSTYVSHDKAKYYRSSAEKILRSVSKNYQSKEKNSAMLLHSVGSFPGHGEVDASLIYADYYYMEAYSHRESNSDQRFRKPPFYPLNYGSIEFLKILF
jgi:unsaturated chondroitin disaccharide hydrolase